MNFNDSLFLAQTDWTITTNWCDQIIIAGLLGVLLVFVLALPLAILLWSYFQGLLFAGGETVRAGGADDGVIMDPKIGRIFDAAPDEVDDLTKMAGVGGVLAGKLNDLGIYRYQQIAEWSDDVAREFGERLSSKDRAIRDNWREQAAELHEAKYR